MKEIESKYEMIYDEENLHKLILKSNNPNVIEMYNNLQEMKHLKRKILKKIKCKRCGWCCRSCNAMLTKKDIMLLKKYLKLGYDQLYEKYFDKNAKIPYLRLPCPFLNEDNECDIYYFRPETCKEFPFNEFFTVIENCHIGKEINNIIDKKIYPMSDIDINQKLQNYVDNSDEFVKYILNRNHSSGKCFRITINKNILEKLIGILKNNNG